MKSPFQHSGPVIVLIALVTLAAVVSSPLVHAERNAAPTSPSLHNPNFDNGDWYEFNDRYQSSYPTGAWVPAGSDMYDTTQDWRLWFMDGTDIVDCDPDPNRKHSGTESAKIRSFTWSDKNRQVAGLYQVIEDVTPCLYYQFQMYAWSRQEGTDDWLAALQVGIEPNGEHPDSANNPAIHGDWPGGPVMGDSHAYTSGFGPLVVTAEALSTEIVVFTYADAYGGNSHKIQWDTGSFERTTSPDMVSDPNTVSTNLGQINSGPTAGIGRTGATVNWGTSVGALAQVYYRQVPASSTPPPPSTDTLTRTVYLPSLFSALPPSPWLSSDVNEAFTSYHSVNITGLQPNTRYEYFVVSRGVETSIDPNTDTCATWVSAKQIFTTLP